ncbi:DUF2142 domain-containing protein [Cellulomonas denverensis]|uniref:DUF2142 domain-containing protein n=1 Tax=Cellulomonas denverensis TaxID=264297 RepID=A0A7X6QYV1_9CELL|nr:DUF2142 domain-containing protein [Cellulomonas denverensis]NKY22508.1 DUF2142 domain-containing protein [Cellulomonas denverensis]GIG25982.1 hypothetical protein Cde04nite_22260 [Cellulomonas denverensis]
MTDSNDLPVQDRTGRGRRLLTVLGWIGAVLGLGSLGAAWSFASPVGASADEPAHLVYAYGVATGQVLPGQETMWSEADASGEQGAGPARLRVTVPEALMDLEFVDCYITNSADTPSCGPREFPPDWYDADGNISTRTYMTRYSPVYYWPVGMTMRAALEFGASGEWALGLARLVSTAWSVGLLSIAFAVLRRRFRAAGLVAVGAAVLIPSAWSLMTSINPNGFEIASAILLAACVAAVRHDRQARDRVGVWLQVLLVLAAFMLAWSRPLSFVWAGALLLILLLPVRGRRWSVSGLSWWTVGGAAAVVLGGFGWMLWSIQLRSDTQADADVWAASSPGLRIVAILLRFGDMATDSLAAMGWREYNLPMLTVVLSLVVPAAVLGALAAGARRPAVRPWAAAGFLTLTLLAIVLHTFVTGFGWQGRYILALFAAAVVLLTPALQGQALSARQRRRAGLVALASATLVMAVSLTLVLWRYIYGTAPVFMRFPDLPYPHRAEQWTPLVGQAGVFVLAGIGLVLVAVAAVGSLVRDGGAPVPGTGEPALVGPAPGPNPPEDDGAEQVPAADPAVVAASVPGATQRPSRRDLRES